MINTEYAVKKYDKNLGSRLGIHVYDSFTDKLYMFVIYILLIFALIVVLVPLIFVVASSFSSPTAVASGRVLLWPVDPSLEGYAAVFRNDKLIRSFANTVLYATLNIVANLVLMMFAAYPLSRKDLKYRKFIMFFFTFTMFFNGGMIPTYLVVRSLGLLDTIWAMVIPSAMSVWNVIVARTYIQSSIPFELYESASLDGCSDFTYLWKIVVPLSTPILAVIALFVGVGVWNSYFNALIYLQNYDLYPLQMVLRDILILGNTDTMLLNIKEQMERQKMQYLLQYSTIVVSSVPVMLLYPFAQRYFVRGVMIGSLKG